MPWSHRRSNVSGVDGTADGGGGAERAGDLSARERAVLDIAGRQWPGVGARERAIRERLGISPTLYYQLLNALLDDPRAMEHAPGTVHRLRRARDERRGRQ
jgi:Protein of unknown function (DUF3263)